MRDTITLRTARADELATAAEFWIEMYEEAGIWKRADFAAGWERRFIEYFAQRIDQGEAQFTVALQNDRIVGTAGALVADGYPVVISSLRFGYIFGVRVVPEFRSRGVATALTREAIAFLKSLNCRRIRLHASSMGRPIYERLGFVPTNEMQLA